MPASTHELSDERFGAVFGARRGSGRQDAPGSSLADGLLGACAGLQWRFIAGHADAHTTAGQMAWIELHRDGDGASWVSYDSLRSAVGPQTTELPFKGTLIAGRELEALRTWLDALAAVATAV